MIVNTLLWCQHTLLPTLSTHSSLPFPPTHMHFLSATTGEGRRSCLTHRETILSREHPGRSETIRGVLQTSVGTDRVHLQTTVGRIATREPRGQETVG